MSSTLLRWFQAPWKRGPTPTRLVSKDSQPSCQGAGPARCLYFLRFCKINPFEMTPRIFARVPRCSTCAAIRMSDTAGINRSCHHSEDIAAVDLNTGRSRCLESRRRGFPRSAADLLLNRVRDEAGKGVAATDVALSGEEDVAQGGGCVARCREVGAGGEWRNEGEQGLNCYSCHDRLSGAIAS